MRACIGVSFTLGVNNLRAGSTTDEERLPIATLDYGLRLWQSIGDN